MKFAKEAKSLIRTLENRRFYASCPRCDGSFLLKRAGLFHLDDFTDKAERLHKRCLAEVEKRKTDLKAVAAELRRRRKAISEKSEITARAVKIGFNLERLAPCMKSFPFEQSDCRSLFNPIDFVVFDGLSKKGAVSKLFFLDVKTGRARLTHNQKEIKNLIEQKCVDWDSYKP